MGKLILKDITCVPNSVCDIVKRFYPHSIDELIFEGAKNKLKLLNNTPVAYAYVTLKEEKIDPVNYWRMSNEERERKTKYIFLITGDFVVKKTRFCNIKIHFRSYSHSDSLFIRLWGHSTNILYEGLEYNFKRLLKTDGPEVVYQFYDKDIYWNIIPKMDAVKNILADFIVGYSRFTRWSNVENIETFFNKEVYDANLYLAKRFIVSRFKNENLRIDEFNLYITTDGLGNKVMKNTCGLKRSATRCILDPLQNILRFKENAEHKFVVENEDAIRSNKVLKNFFLESYYTTALIPYMYSEKIPLTDRVLSELVSQRTLEIL